MALCFIPAAVLAVAVALPGAARAATLIPGDTVIMPGTTAASNPEVAGATLATQQLFWNSYPQPSLFIQGGVHEVSVQRSDVTGGTIISHTLTNWINTATDVMLIDGFSITGYAGFDTDVSYRTDLAGDRGPTTAERSADGDTLSFNFFQALNVGYLVQQVREDSFPVSILTDANSYEATGRMTIWGRIVGDTSTDPFSVSIGGVYVPSMATPIPLPASMLLLLGAVAGLVGFGRRARSA
ncbi:hypothetical protein JQU17_16605 [Ponticoccus sp. SC2-23]|uniref:hypothetical protein n=1 Tax=Alexandriicola marinus TaxID=2081710 RepID=UPI000FDB1FF9|nr:hypothetical protein [Alexandriicola marinus]MBM1220978.1 hypothetical protein [Ponticoccus sp. SC6-9]MBM1225548.1 hypothetical protein [Ponticoccus sp. SC6-15]MBM1231889.1 hypothetical protein [Ponticoccus sp. SC6-38]MBM1236390.1 hypothetical protein [Ponticoccus sp. SC6-45]MBM1240911.1 hypothetical protein [Ponticoccus sp. SC6-49]MBM1243471.1 hypothetical protein [Ponticoccus sp. SC2-64]MBM1249890.1 hypothetical protein [Ponticoccus sp. SC6-42]MBM1254380.1 hypothetical protein [Pontico